MRTLDVRADGVAAARLGLEEPTPLVYLERLRLAADEPLAVDRVWLPERLAAALLEVDFSRTALYDRPTSLPRRPGAAEPAVTTPDRIRVVGVSGQGGRGPRAPQVVMGWKSLATARSWGSPPCACAQAV